MTDHEDLSELLKWPDQLGPDYTLEETEAPQGWEKAYVAKRSGEVIGSTKVQLVTKTPYDATYPAGVRDRLVKLESADDESVGPEALQLTAEKIFADDDTCRRIVLSTPVEDIPQIARGESAGFRYVVDVELLDEDRQVVERSLMAAEPAWVIEQSMHLDDVPTH